MKIALEKPIIAFAKEVSEIDLRDATGKDLRICGTPFRVHPDGVPIYNEPACAKLISVLGNIPEESVDQLAGRDFVRLCDALVTPFFSPASSQTKPSGNTGNSPGSTTTSEAPSS